MILLFGNAGHPEYELIAGGSEVAVSASNVGDYVEAVVNATLSDGIQGQMKAFRCGLPSPAHLPHPSCRSTSESQSCLHCRRPY